MFIVFIPVKNRNPALARGRLAAAIGVRTMIGLTAKAGEISLFVSRR